MPDRQFTDGIARLVLVAAVYGDLLTALPGAFAPDLFGESSARQRIAEAVARYAEQYPGTRPAPEFIDDLISKDMANRSEAEQDAVADEWGFVQAADLPEDTGYLYQQVREWIEFRRTRDALIAAREVMDKDGGLEEAREILAKVEPLKPRIEIKQEIFWLRDAEERLTLWREGITMGERIPTRMSAFDAAVSGGPTKKEAWYFLAPPKGGKTTFLLNVARGAARGGYGVYYNTFEMQGMRTALRFDQMMAKSRREELAGKDGEIGNIAPLEAAIKGMTAIGSGEIVFTRRATQAKSSVRQTAQDIKRLRNDGVQIDVVVFDYLNIMGGSKNESELRRELFGISYEIADLAQELDVLVWSAALVTRQAVDKYPIRKTDIAEAFGVIAALDGAVAICSPPILVANNFRRLYIAAAREERDEVMAGDYLVEFDRMRIRPADSQRVDQLLESTRKRKNGEETE